MFFVVSLVDKFDTVLFYSFTSSFCTSTVALDWDLASTWVEFYALRIVWLEGLWVGTGNGDGYFKICWSVGLVKFVSTWEIFEVFI